MKRTWQRLGLGCLIAFMSGATIVVLVLDALSDDDFTAVFAGIVLVSGCVGCVVGLVAARMQTVFEHRALRRKVLEANEHIERLRRETTPALVAQMRKLFGPLLDTDPDPNDLETAHAHGELCERFAEAEQALLVANAYYSAMRCLRDEDRRALLDRLGVREVIPYSDEAFERFQRVQRTLEGLRRQYDAYRTLLEQPEIDVSPTA